MVRSWRLGDLSSVVGLRGADLLREVVRIAELIDELDLRLEPVHVLLGSHQNAAQESLAAIVPRVAAERTGIALRTGGLRDRQDAKTAKTPREWLGDRAQHDAFDSRGEPGDVEVDNEAKLALGGLEVREELRGVHWRERRHRLQLHDQPSGDKQVQPPFANAVALVGNGSHRLPRERNIA